MVYSFYTKQNLVYTMKISNTKNCFEDDEFYFMIFTFFLKKRFYSLKTILKGIFCNSCNSNIK